MWSGAISHDALNSSSGTMKGAREQYGLSCTSEELNSVADWKREDWRYEIQLGIKVQTYKKRENKKRGTIPDIRKYRCVKVW